MEVIYIDSLFFLNLAADYFICLASARVCGVTLKRWRYLLAAALGGAYAVGIYLPRMGILALPLMKLTCGIAMCAIAYGGEKRPWNCAAVFFTVSAAFGGAVWALSLAAGGKAGEAYPLVDFRTFFLAFAVCYAALSLIFRRRAGLMARCRAEVTVELLGRKAEFIALSDSGNSLSDPISGADVMIVCPHALKPIFLEDAVIFSLPSAVDTLELANALPHLRGMFRLVPYSALGGGGLLPVFTPQRITVNGKEVKSLLIAVSPRAAGDGFEAIL